MIIEIRSLLITNNFIIRLMRSWHANTTLAFDERARFVTFRGSVLVTLDSAEYN